MLPVVQWQSEAEKRYFADLFNRCTASPTQSAASSLLFTRLPTSQSVAELFSKSLLSQTCLARLWDLVQPSGSYGSGTGGRRSGTFDQNTFNCALRLICLAQQQPGQSPNLSAINSAFTTIDGTAQKPRVPRFLGHEDLLQKHGLLHCPMDCPWMVGEQEWQRFKGIFAQFNQPSVPFSQAYHSTFASTGLAANLLHRIWYLFNFTLHYS
jgi:hypothetical protein